jgi:hypothetical protein
MGIQIVWDNDRKTVVRYIFDRDWTWEDLHAAKNYAYNLIDSVTYPVGVIFDAPPDVRLPANFLSNSMSIFKRKHARTYAVILVGSNAYARSLINMVGKIADAAGQTVKVFPKLDDARAWIASREREHSDEYPLGME